ncbi:MAG: GAF domain-containing protein, partial [Aldersonia sp.]|nr:GAF domain-containing protein [Aldersonia sp.]
MTGGSVQAPNTDRTARLLDAVLAVGAALELPAVLKRIVDAAVDLMDARYGALGVLSPDGARLSEFVHVGMDEQTVQLAGALPMGRGVLGVLIDDPHPLRLADISHHAKSYGVPSGHPPMRSFLGVPILVGDTVFGNLYLTDKISAAEFTDEDVQVATG